MEKSKSKSKSKPTTGAGDLPTATTATTTAKGGNMEKSKSKSKSKPTATTGAGDLEKMQAAREVLEKEAATARLHITTAHNTPGAVTFATWEALPGDIVQWAREAFHLGKRLDGIAEALQERFGGLKSDDIIARLLFWPKKSNGEKLTAQAVYRNEKNPEPLRGLALILFNMGRREIYAAEAANRARRVKEAQEAEAAREAIAKAKANFSEKYASFISLHNVKGDLGKSGLAKYATASREVREAVAALEKLGICSEVWAAFQEREADKGEADKGAGDLPTTGAGSEADKGDKPGGKPATISLFHLQKVREALEKITTATGAGSLATCKSLAKDWLLLLPTGDK